MKKILFFAIIPSSNPLAHLLETSKYEKYVETLSKSLSKNNLQYCVKYDDSVTDLKHVNMNDYDIIIYTASKKLNKTDDIQKPILFIPVLEVQSMDIQQVLNYIMN